METLMWGLFLLSLISFVISRFVGDDDKKEATGDVSDFDVDTDSSGSQSDFKPRKSDRRKGDKLPDGDHPGRDVVVQKKGFWGTLFSSDEDVGRHEKVRVKNGRAKGRSSTGDHDFNGGGYIATSSGHDSSSDGTWLDRFADGLIDDIKDDRSMLDKWFD